MKERQENLRIARIQNVTNALYIAENRDEDLHAFNGLSTNNIKVISEICSFLLMKREVENE